LRAAVTAVFLGSVLAYGQSFDVATVRPSQLGTGGNRIGATSDTLTMSNVTLRIALKLGYDLQDSQIAGTNALDGERFDIVGKAGAPFASQLQMKQMLQALLTERFHLQSHRETRDITSYALVVGKGGPKFQHSSGEGRPSMNGKGALAAQFATMKMLADFLSGPMGRPVQDATGLEGQYDFKFDLMQYLPPNLAPGQEPDVAGMVLNGLEEQLGLKLEARKTPMEVLVVDHAERPDEN
ncbi:MAG TPA: TIGR03435 family protein, partial [Bryobacteraceae bacterium]|nr:TIGR03435 family protein [Bryobacteraceae bacterium]